MITCKLATNRRYHWAQLSHWSHKSRYWAIVWIHCLGLMDLYLTKCITIHAHIILDPTSGLTETLTSLPMQTHPADWAKMQKACTMCSATSSSTYPGSYFSRRFAFVLPGVSSPPLPTLKVSWANSYRQQWNPGGLAARNKHIIIPFHAAIQRLPLLPVQLCGPAQFPAFALCPSVQPALDEGQFVWMFNAAARPGVGLYGMAQWFVVAGSKYELWLVWGGVCGSVCLSSWLWAFICRSPV